MKKQEGFFDRQKGNMKKQAFITMAILFAIVTMVGGVFAGDVAGKKGMAMGDEVQSHNVGKLTDDQKNQLKALHQKFIDETATQRAAIIAKHQEIRILMETSSPDKEKLHALSADVTELRRQVMDKKIDLALEAKKISPEINFPMGFRGFSKHGMEMDDVSMMGGDDEMMDGGMRCKGKGMMGGHGMRGKKSGCGSMMMDKGMGGKMNCPAMSSMPDNTESKSVEKDSKKN